MHRKVKFAAVTASVALALAACGGGDDATDTTGTAASGGDGGATVSVTGTDALKWDPTELSASAGSVTVTVEAGGAVNHTFIIEELGTDPLVEVGAGETASADVELEPGEYTFYCDIPGHREAGMEGTLTVS